MTLRVQAKREAQQLSFFARAEALIESLLKPGNSVAVTMTISVNSKKSVDRIAKAIDAVPVWRDGHWSAIAHDGAHSMEVVFVLRNQDAGET